MSNVTIMNAKLVDVESVSLRMQFTEVAFQYHLS